MPDVHIYLPKEMYIKIQKAGDVSKTIQEALTLLWRLQEKGKKKGGRK